MSPSDTDLIVAAQSGEQSSKQATEELLARFGNRLRYFAGRACQLYNLRATEIEDIVQNAIVALLDPGIARFNPGRGDQVLAYLHGLIQNAARTHGHFVHRGDDKRHDWTYPLNPILGLPSSIEAIPDAYQSDVESHDEAMFVLAMADDDERDLIDRVFFYGETPKDVADSLRVDRSTVSRRLSQFYKRVQTRSHLFVGSEPPCPN